MTLLDQVDPRLQPLLKAEWERRRGERVEALPCDVTVVLAGHRAAGKTQMLQPVAKALGRHGVDLDAELVRRHQRPLQEWILNDERDFRVAERETFRSLPSGLVVAVGGGFLSLHAELLRSCVTVEVPISFETYVERLTRDTTRPRLRPGVPLDQELREIYSEREFRHAAARPLSLIDFMLRLVRGRRPRRVVTLPPHAPLEVFAWRARHAGAELLEIRSDLHPAEIDLLAASRALPLLIARRTERLPDAWRSRATLIDEPLGGLLDPSVLRSFHAAQPLKTREALATWDGVVPGSRVKHVEPLGSPRDFPRLLETQQALIERFGVEHVTVLATGPWALPFRAVLAQRNALDYLALDATWSAAEGQRLIADAVREAALAQVDGRTRRLGILGQALGHSRSPRIHQQPFDRIDLGVDAPLDELLDALQPHYRGLAVTNPFKKRIAGIAHAPLPAVNTLIRAADGWHAENSDVAGAEAILAAFQPATRVTVLGDGGVTAALRLAAANLQVELEVLPRGAITAQPLRGPIVWTWPALVPVPGALRFEDAQVAVIAYGTPARSIVNEIIARGGTPRRLGPRWFIAQARRQRLLWESAT
ncbi:MAG: shikimate kinase [Archangium sp.]|nr:shikimate kinase [Archangium sp.]